jgi:hypothetical protein
MLLESAGMADCEFYYESNTCFLAALAHVGLWLTRRYNFLEKVISRSRPS